MQDKLKDQYLNMLCFVEEEKEIKGEENNEERKERRRGRNVDVLVRDKV